MADHHTKHRLPFRDKPHLYRVNGCVWVVWAAYECKQILVSEARAWAARRSVMDQLAQRKT